MNIKNIFILMGALLVSVSLHAGQCESAKSKADTDCDGEKLADLKAALDAEDAKYRSANNMDGSTKMTEAQIAQVQAAMMKNGEFRGKCVQAIQQCSDKCQMEKAEGDAEQNQAKSQNAENARKFCTEGKPKKVAEQAEKNQGDMSKTLGALAQMLSALTGLMKPGEETPVTDECTVSATNTATMVQNNANCSTDIATASPGTTFATGDYRAAKGLSSATNPLGTGQVGMGTAAKQELSGASAGGGGFGGGFGGGRMGGAAPAAAATASKDEKLLPASTFGGGGGGGKSASGGGGGSGKPGAYGQITKSSIDDERLMQSAVDKAMQQRGPASDGPPGGISGAFSLDNFIKVEKRIQNERNQLNEL